jgi:uncharacterized protein (TIGR02466 family)
LVNNYEVLPLWATPVYNSILKSDDDIKSFMKNLSYERVQANNGFYSINKKVLDIDRMNSLRKEILEHVTTYAREVSCVSENIEFYITNSWVMKHEPADWSQSHCHTNSIFSGVYYFDIPENSGVFFFEKDGSCFNLFSTIIDLPVSSWNTFNSKAWQITPRNDMIIIFPSQVRHSVSRNDSQQERYCLAFNVFVKGHIKTDLAELSL